MAQTKILLVDDDLAVLRAHARALSKAGYEVETAADGEAAIRSLQGGSFEVVLSDIDMPGMDGIRLLERVRGYDLDVPIIFITGAPSVDTAVQAMERGALRYLMKPIGIPQLVSAADDAVKLHRIAKAKRQALDLAGGLDKLVGDRAGLEASFLRTLETLYVAYQPIVSWSSKNVFAFEALLRSREPSLPHPGAVLEAAERLGQLHVLGRRIREKAIEKIGDSILFINLHPRDLLDDQLYQGPLSTVARQVVLEITERAPLDQVPDVTSRVADLKRLGFRIAIDDLGAGYAGLTSFSLLSPDIAKLDMSLIRGLHLHPTKQTLVRTMTSMCNELGILVTGEGVETVEERDELARAGCDLMQGYLFAKPADPFPTPSFG